MSLPTAPLGQMPNMSMPYAIPHYEQPKSALEQALVAFLVNTAGGVATQGVDNAMSHDYAGQMGGKNTTFMQKLLGGANNSQSDYGRYQADQSAKDLQASGQTNALELQDRGFTNSQDAAHIAALNDRLTQDRAYENSQDTARLGALNAQTLQDSAGTRAEALARLKAELGAPEDKARTDYYTAQANNVDQQTQVSKDTWNAQKEKASLGGISEQDKAAAAAMRAKNQVPATPQPSAQIAEAQHIQKIMEGLKAGKTVDQILAEEQSAQQFLSSQQDAFNNAPISQWEQDYNARRIAAEEILRRMGAQNTSTNVSIHQPGTLY